MRYNEIIITIISISILLLYFNSLSAYFPLYSCIVIRVNHPSNKQIKRYLHWKKYFPQNCHIFLLSTSYINNSLLNISKIKLVVVTFKEIFNYYPNIKHLKGNCSSFKTPRLLLWVSHTESIIILYNKLKFKYNFVWIIEQDVGYVGNLFKFINMYRNDDSDLITFGVGKINPKWIWFNCATEQYLKRRREYFKYNYGYANRECVQRWSKKYINELQRDLYNNFHSQTETSSIELVFYHNLSYSTIPYKYIGYVYNAGKSLTENQWINITKTKDNKNKLFHPLKF